MMADPPDTWTDVCGDVAYETPPSKTPDWRDGPKEMEMLYRIAAELLHMGILCETETVKLTGDYL